VIGRDLPDNTYVTVTNPIPAGLAYAGGLAASSGTASIAGGAVLWKGWVSSGSPVTLQYNAVLSSPGPAYQVYQSTAAIEDGLGGRFQKSTAAVFNGIPVFLPLVSR